MLNNIPIQEGLLVYKRRRRLERHIAIKKKRKVVLSLTISLGFIIMTSFFITHSIYISSNSKDLSFAVDHNFTTGFSSTNKLLRVQKMTLVYNDGETAVVEASGLAKSSPHKSISIKGSFKKDDNNSWHLEKIFTQ